MQSRGPEDFRRSLMQYESSLWNKVLKPAESVPATEVLIRDLHSLKENEIFTRVIIERVRQLLKLFSDLFTDKEKPTQEQYVKGVHQVVTNFLQNAENVKDDLYQLQSIHAALLPIQSFLQMHPYNAARLKQEFEEADPQPVTLNEWELFVISYLVSEVMDFNPQQYAPAAIFFGLIRRFNELEYLAPGIVGDLNMGIDEDKAKKFLAELEELLLTATFFRDVFHNISQGNR